MMKFHTAVRVGLLAAIIGLAACAALKPAPPPKLLEQTDTPTDASEFLEDIERKTFDFFWANANPKNGLVPDRYPTRSFASLAAVGFALTAYPIGVERGYVSRAEALERVRITLRFFHDAPQGTSTRDVTGYKGFFYTFLD